MKETKINPVEFSVAIINLIGMLISLILFYFRFSNFSYSLDSFILLTAVIFIGPFLMFFKRSSLGGRILMLTSSSFCFVCIAIELFLHYNFYYLIVFSFVLVHLFCSGLLVVFEANRKK